MSFYRFDCMSNLLLPSLCDGLRCFRFVRIADFAAVEFLGELPSSSVVDYTTVACYTLSPSLTEGCPLNDRHDMATLVVNLLN